MANRTNAIDFLNNHDLWNCVLNINLEEPADSSVLNVLKHIESSGRGDKQPDLDFYWHLAAEYERYLQKEHLDNITLVITGVGNTSFADGKHLIVEARRRLESSPFGSHMDIYENNSELTVLWFPTTPFSLNDFKASREVLRSNIQNHFAKELGLIVDVVSFSIIDGGGGREDFFYDHYFAPRKIKGILEGSAILPSCDSNGEETIMTYILEGNAEMLKDAVKSHLSAPVGFDLYLPEKFEPTGHTVFFMPFFKVCLNVRSDQSAKEIKQLVDHRFEVVESMEFGDHLYLECRSHEGPYAETASDIVQNIHDELSPHVMRVLGELGLEVLNILFILTDTEH